MPASTSQHAVVGQLSLLNHRNWRHRDVLAQFLADDYDESRYLASTLSHSSSDALDALASLLSELQTELHSVILTHHSQLLQGNTQILKIEQEVQAVLRRVNSLRAALTRIQHALMQPFDQLSASLQQLQAMQHTAEHIRQAIRVLHCCDKLKQIVSPSGGHGSTPLSSPAAASLTSPAHSLARTPRTPGGAIAAAASSSTLPALRELVKCASLLFEVQQVFSSVNLNGVTAVDAQLPFLNQVAELLQNQGRRSMYEALRGGGGGVASTHAAGASPSAATPHINQLDINYVVQLFYNLAPNPHAESTLRTLLHASGDDQQRGRRGSGGSRRAAPALTDAVAAERDDDDAANVAARNGGGVELALLLEELVSSYLQQVRAALRRIFDVAASAHALNLQEASKRSKGKKGVAALAAAAAAATSAPSPHAAPSSATSLRSTLWDRLDSFTDLLFHLTLSLWTLSKLLQEKRDLVINQAPGVSFDTIYRVQKALLREMRRKEARKAGRTNEQDATPVDESLLHTWWRLLCDLLRSEFGPIAESDASASSSSSSSSSSSAHSHNFLRTIFVNEYPRLHALFDRSLVERVVKYIAGHAASASAHSIIQTATISSPSHSASAAASAAAFANSGGGVDDSDAAPPTLSPSDRQDLLQGTFLPFFQLYLTRCLTQLTEPIKAMFTAHEALGAAPAVPSKSDVGAYIGVMHSMLDNVAATERGSSSSSNNNSGPSVSGDDGEVARLQVRVLEKSVVLFLQHAERMVQSGEDRDMFSSSHMPPAGQLEGHMGTGGGGGGGVLTKSTSSATSLAASKSAGSMVSSTQRTNLDVFAILSQLERELTYSELQRRYPHMFPAAAVAAAQRGTQANGVSNAATSTSGSGGSWATMTSSSSSHLSPALAGLRECWQRVRTAQTALLRVLLSQTSTNLCACFPPMVVELDGEPGADPKVAAASQNFAASAPPSDGCPAMLAFRKRVLYCMHILFPLYTNMLSGGSNAAAQQQPPSADVASRLSMFQSTVVVPLHASLCTSFLHAVTLVPLSTPQAPTLVNENMRAHHTAMLTHFEALMQQLHRQPKRSSRGVNEGAAGGDAAPLPIDGVHAWKELLYSRDGEHLHHLTSRALDAVTMLHFLFTNCSVHAGGSSSPAGVSHTAPHRLLQMRVEDYLAFVASHNQIEIFELFANKVYTSIEARIPAIPKGGEGRTYLKEHFPNLNLALKVLTKH